MTSCTVLTYHSQNISGDGTDNNDHVALREDLECLHTAGFSIIPLSAMVDWLESDAGTIPERPVCLSFDDGCDFDVVDLEFPGHGLQRSFLGVMRDFRARHGPDAQVGLHATSFVLASAEARRLIDAQSLFGHGWMSDSWWRQAASDPLLSIGNHGWDHAHPDVGGGPGGFLGMDDQEQCELQVVRSADYIEQTAGLRPDLFAYPFGQSSDYLRTRFFPETSALHRCRAAFGTRPGAVTRESDRWNLPRIVCGRDWRTPAELLALLEQ